MSNLRTTLTIALVALGVAISAGCGSESAGNPPAAKAADMPVEQYVAEMDALRKTVDDARSDYFHAGKDVATRRDHARRLTRAYRTAAERLDAIAPPAEAADVHRRILEIWRKRSDQVAAILAAKPFRKMRLADLMYGTDRDGALYEEAFRLY